MGNKFLNFYSKTIRIIEKIEVFCITLLLGVMIILISLEIFSRFILGFSFPWVQEVVLLLSIWLVFIATAVAYKQKKYIIIHYFQEKFPHFLRSTLRFIVNLIMICFFTFLAYYSFLYQKYQFGIENPMLGISTFYFTLPVLVGSISILVSIIYSAVTECIAETLE